jgi:hypothetical protein
MAAGFPAFTGAAEGLPAALITGPLGVANVRFGPKADKRGYG